MATSIDRARLILLDEDNFKDAACDCLKLEAAWQTSLTGAARNQSQVHTWATSKIQNSGTYLQR